MITRTAPIFFLLSILITCLVFSTSPVNADGFKLASFSFEQVPSAEINISDNEANELKTSASTYTTKLAIPIKLDGKRRVLLNFLTFRVLHQSYENTGSAGFNFLPTDLYTIKYGLVLHHVLSSQWSLNLLVQPALLTDLTNLSSDHFTLRGGFIFERKVSDKLTYAIGGGYSDDYGNEIILPVWRIKWKLNWKWLVNLDFPQKLEISYKLSDKVKIGVMGKTTGGHYRIGQEITYLPDSTRQVSRIKYSIVNVGPSIEWKASKHLQFIVNAGTSVYRRYEVFDTDGGELINSDFESSLFIKASLNFMVGK